MRNDFKCRYDELYVSAIEGKSQREFNRNDVSIHVALCPVTRYNTQLIAWHVTVVTCEL